MQVAFLVAVRSKLYANDKRRAKNEVCPSLVRESGYPAGYTSNDGIELEQTSLHL